MRIENFPIGFCCSLTADEQKVADVKDWADAGITVAIGPAYMPSRGHRAEDLRAILDEAGRRGIRVLHSDERFDWTRYPDLAARREAAAEAVREFGMHPAVAGFVMHGELERHEFEAAVGNHRLFHEAARGPSEELLDYGCLLPHLPGTESRVGWSDWGAYLDRYVGDSGAKLLSYDCYSPMSNEENGFDLYFQNLREHEAAASRHGIPLWNVVLSTGHHKYRCPTEAELRWQLNTSAAHGAKGVFWFHFHLARRHENYRCGPMDEFGERTDRFDAFARVNKTFLRSTAAWFLELELRTVTHWGKAYGGYPLWSGPTRLVHRVSSNNGTPLSLSEFADAAGGNYLAVVNLSMTEPTRLDLTVRGERPDVRVNGWNDESYGKSAFAPKEIAGRGEDFATVRLYLAPGQMTLLEIRKGE